MSGYGALVYGYAAVANDIVNMPKVDRYKDNRGHVILIDTEDVSPVEWAYNHYKYGEYVHPEDITGYYSDKIIFGVFLGESGDELNIENMEDVKRSAADISKAIDFFCGIDTDISDYGYHIITIYD